MARLCLVVLVGASCINAKSPPDDPHNPYLPLAALEAEEASRLRLPEAEVLRRVGGERFNNITGPQGSFTGAVHTVYEASITARSPGTACPARLGG